MLCINKKLLIKHILSALLLFFTAFLLPTRVFCQSVPADSLVTARLASIRQIIDKEKTRTNQWWYGWLAGYSAATVVQTAVCLTSEDLSTRQDMALGAVTTLLGAAGQFISPVKPIKEWQRIKNLPDLTEEDRQTKLAESEKLLEKIALNEKEGRSWKTHAVSGAVNLGSGLVTWLGFKRSIWAGLGIFAINTSITETQIFTQPKRAMKEYDKYLQKNGAISAKGSGLSLSLNVYPGGISIVLGF
jgi:hypothetical protein